MTDGFTGEGVDLERANAARMYDYLLGGGHNFDVDRRQADLALAGHPALRHLARENRAYLRRVVLWALDQGIDQFLDLGSGVPTVGNVHEVAHALNPAARVAYVDFEPVAVAHATEIIGRLGVDTVTVTRGDMREPDEVLHSPGVTGLIDFTRPVAVLAIAVLHFVEGDAAALINRYHRDLAPGSVVAISHSTDDSDDPDTVASIRAVRDAYARSATPLILRDRTGIAAALDGVDLVSPGVVDVVDWPGPRREGTAPTSVYAAVGRV